MASAAYRNNGEIMKISVSGVMAWRRRKAGVMAYQWHELASSAKRWHHRENHALALAN
jgi:hypothetical protein